ncbi:MAG: nucleotide exchange factor GrpE [Planctomycetes bacterium]|nr:nucleotide exchange factor GrpE [Planctomycetota bacterium]
MSKRKHRKIEVATAEETDRYGSTGQTGAETVTDEARSGAPPTCEPDMPQQKQSEPAAAGPTDEAPVDPLEALRRQLADANDKHLRAVAELQNFRRRASAEKQETLRYGAADLIRAVLTVVDDFERTLAALAEHESSSVVQGIELIHDNLLKALAAHHVERVSAAGQTFDPNLHEAIMQQPSPDHPAGAVLQEVQAGYRLWDRVLRPAKVIVSTGPERHDRSDGDEQTTDPSQPRAETEADSSDGNGSNRQEPA